MMAQLIPESSESLTRMANEIFELTKMAWRQRLAVRASDTETELSESQFLTLDSLIRQDRQTVGELQRYLGVIPAQMSRIIRSLEGGFPRPLIACALNPKDKRKIDVTLTAAGRTVYETFKQGRLERSLYILRGLSHQDRTDFVRVCQHMRDLYAKDEATRSADSGGAASSGEEPL
ncbi:MAG: MarR family transcriptional regulator [Phycisphaerales bacterium]|nr:MarR family transcriptional regulator [Phycisphaerales bacterium]